MPPQSTREELKRQAEEHKRKAAEGREKAIAAFPFERVETTGDQALIIWQQLKVTGRGSPVVLGGDASVANLMDHFDPTWPGVRTATEILTAADGLRHPEDLRTRRTVDHAKALEHLKRLFENQPDGPLPKVIVADSHGNQRELTREETRASMLNERKPPPLGDWPAKAASVSGLSVAVDDRSRQLLQKVHIALMPTDDWTAIPAHLRWGGWNDCPHPEYHVAALRSWRDRFGVELVGLGSDKMDLTVARPPQSRAEALELAREHYVYCSDIVDQALGSLSALAACLLGNPWWSFWWD